MADLNFDWPQIQGFLKPEYCRYVAGIVGDHFQEQNKKHIEILEIGTYYGRTSIGFALQLMARGFTVHVDTCDIYEMGHEQYLDHFATLSDVMFNISRAGLEGIVHPHKVSVNENIPLKFAEKKYDFVYIDACHEYKQALADCVSALCLAAPNGIIAGDDWEIFEVHDAVMSVFPQEKIFIDQNQWAIRVNDVPHYLSIAKTSVEKFVNTPDKYRTSVYGTVANKPKMAIAFPHCRRICYSTISVPALLNCYGIDDIPIIYSVDIHEEHRRQSEEVYSYIKSVLRPQDTLLRNDPRLGLDLSKFTIIREALHLADRFIFLEDDLIPSKDALLWFESVLDEFKDKPDCISISSYRRIIDRQAYTLNPNKLEKRDGFNPWFWGMWKDRYEELMGNIDSTEFGEHYKQTYGDSIQTKHDYHWEHHIKNNNKYTIRPELSRVQCIGAHHGEHTIPEFFWENEYNKIWAGDLPDEDLLKYSKLPLEYDLSLPIITATDDKSNLT